MSSNTLGPNGAGPTVDQAGPLIPPSPAEILMEILRAHVDPRIVRPSDVVVGPADEHQQERGCVQITDAGSSDVKRNVPLIFGRLQLRILHREVTGMDQLGYHVYQVVHGRHREVVTLRSSGVGWLVHRTNVLAGPSAHYDSQVTWENLMFVECVFGTTPA